MASLSMSPQERASIESFRRDVVEASLHSVVLVRFTAEWCGPCKQLAPIIDKAVAEVGGGRTKQVVIDIDQNRVIAEQFRVQSVPTVYAFLGGQPVDGFVGAKSEREIKTFIEKHLASLPPSAEEAGLDQMLEEAQLLLNEGDAAAAADAFAILAREAPERADIIAGYARALLALGQTAGAAAALAVIPADSKDPAVVQARAALDLAAAAADTSEVALLEARVAADGTDHDARIALSNALFAAGNRDAAAEHLLASIAADPAWQEGLARARLLKLIEAVGLGDPWSAALRRRLSAILFT